MSTLKEGKITDVTFLNGTRSEIELILSVLCAVSSIILQGRKALGTSLKLIIEKGFRGTKKRIRIVLSKRGLGWYRIFCVR